MLGFKDFFFKTKYKIAIIIIIIFFLLDIKLLQTSDPNPTCL